jgi:four helix bundle protein
METPYDIHDRTFLYACRIVDFCKPVLLPRAAVRELACQLIRSGTSVGANIEEATGAESRRDFRSKLAISRKEAREARFWLRVIAHAEPRLNTDAVPLIDETRQLIQIITTMKLNSERNHER